MTNDITYCTGWRTETVIAHGINFKKVVPCNRLESCQRYLNPVYSASLGERQSFMVGPPADEECNYFIPNKEDAE